jgi:phospholipase D1/2
MVDFQDVNNWDKNKLDRTQSSRMGWSDVSLCLTGTVVQDLRTHFTQRWNFIYDEKYGKKDTRYARLPDTASGAQQGGAYPPPPTQQRGFDGEDEGERGFEGEEGERGLFGRSGGGGFREKIYSKVNEGYQQMEEHRHGQGQHRPQQSHAEHGSQRGNVECQITRSVSKWSHNISTEVSLFYYNLVSVLTLAALDPKCLLRDHKKQQAFRVHRKPILHHRHWVS